jgi:hypothetical protein
MGVGIFRGGDCSPVNTCYVEVEVEVEVEEGGAGSTVQ